MVFWLQMLKFQRHHLLTEVIMQIREFKGGFRPLMEAREEKASKRKKEF